MFNLKLKKSVVPRNRTRWLCVVAVSVLLAACGAEDPDGPGGDPGGMTGNGGIIGTGVTLEGTASNKTQFASTDIEIKSSTGEKSVAAIGNRGRFQAADLNGTGPYLLRAETGNGEFLYSIGHPQTDGKIAQNIHSYTDAAARNWFASNGLDIDSAFLGDAPIANLPTQSDLRSIAQSLQDIVSAALTEYDLPGTDLSSISFEADNTGVDQFLNNNPVVINNGTINILILDRDTQVSTPSSSNVSIDTDLMADDLEAPSTPDSVRALAASLNEIVVVWNASTDNIGVTAYEVFRDGVSVATTPFPVYTDTGLTANTQYSYTVVAVDSSGNNSADSLMAMSETLAIPDSIAPPTPLMVMLEPSLASIGVSWAQADVFDVKAFNVYRTGPEEATFKVTSDFITDIPVLNGTEYCYQVSAEDASGNESARTAIQCTTTSGATTPPETVDPVVPPVVTPGELIAPTLDVAGMACTQELPNNGTFSADSVLSAGCYLAPRGIRVNEPANLTIEPGVVVKFGASRQLYVTGGASLTAIGTQAAPIVFSGIDPTAGFWDGVLFYFTNSTRNQFDFVQVEYAGSATGANVLARSSGASPARLSVTNSTVRNGLGYGFRFETGAILGAFDGNLMTGNNIPLSITTDSANAISSSSNYSGNTIDQVTLSRANVVTATRLAKIDVPYVSGDLTVKNQLTVEPGVEIKFEADAQLYIDQEAALTAIGTALEPILFTAVDATPGFWDGVLFYFSAGASELAHVTVEYGGAGSSGANLKTRSSLADKTRLAASNVTLRHSLSDGFYFEAGTALTKFDQITSTLNAKTGTVATDVAGKIGVGGSFMGNNVDYIEVINGTVTANESWLKHDVPYLLENLSIDADLTLVPGVTFVMESGGKVTIDQDGSLSAIGTPLENIVFTGKEMIPGYWDGLEYYFTPSTANRLSHVVVEYGGGGIANADQAGNVRMRCSAASVSRLSIDNVMLNFSFGWGMHADANGCQVDLGLNVTYTSNAQGGFNLMP